MKMTKLLADYLKQENLDVTILSKKTGISVSKLTGKSQKPLSAEELLLLCQEIGIKPEQLWNEREDKGGEKD